MSVLKVRRAMNDSPMVDSCRKQLIKIPKGKRFKSGNKIKTDSIYTPFIFILGCLKLRMSNPLS